MTVTLRGTSAECAESVRRLGMVLEVARLSAQEPDPERKGQVQVTAEVRFG